MGKIKHQSKAKVKVNINATDSINEKVFSDIITFKVDIDQETGDFRLNAFGYLMYNDGVKDVKIDNINIELSNSEIIALLGTQLADLEAILEKIAINKVAEKLKLTDADFEKKDNKKAKIK